MRFFETRFLEDADEFIAGLDPKKIKKFYTILTLLSKLMILSFLRSFKTTFGSSEQNTPDLKFDFWLFGTRQTIQKLS
jgi:hypothetical protein